MAVAVATCVLHLPDAPLDEPLAPLLLVPEPPPPPELLGPEQSIEPRMQATATEESRARADGFMEATRIRPNNMPFEGQINFIRHNAQALYSPARRAPRLRRKFSNSARRDGIEFVARSSTLWASSMRPASRSTTSQSQVPSNHFGFEEADRSRRTNPSSRRPCLARQSPRPVVAYGSSGTRTRACRQHASACANSPWRNRTYPNRSSASLSLG